MKRPVVSIIGRPNVGKSTLFNRIIGRREAIVDDEPGITRDRKCANAEWENVFFTLVDTGGYIHKSQDIIETGVTQQVRIAMEEADLVVFLVDATTGITSEDDFVADLLRKSGKYVIVAVNKVDNEKRESDAAEFHRLGLGDPVGISALVGRNTGDLLARIVGQLKKETSPSSEEKEDALHLAIVGKPNVGKSTFINIILGEERLLVTEIPGTTRDPVDVRIRYHGQSWVLIDTAGMRKRTKVKQQVEYYSYLRTHRIIENCDVACVFVSADEGLTQQDMRVIREVVDARKGILIVANKWDLIKRDKDKKKKWDEELLFRLQGFPYIPVLTVSCITNLRVRKVLEFVNHISEQRSKRISSSFLNRLIEDLNRQYQPPAVQGKRIRILYGAQVGTHPPKIALFANHPDLIKDSYKRFIENKIREKFGFEGVPISLLFRRK